MSITRTSMIELTSDECLDLLATRQPRVGRLAFEDPAGPMVFPMPYIAEARAIYFCGAPGNTLLAALEMRQVSFEVDHVDEVPEPDSPELREEGWSVLAFGRLRVLTDEEELAWLRRSPLQPRAHDDHPHYLRMDIATLTGRRYDARPPLMS
jgi:nitroimidazol reductase NimA-like FMN-containing flavoprotein (pyridoxamine 5'-phosphate oxidase superfamily)